MVLDFQVKAAGDSMNDYTKNNLGSNSVKNNDCKDLTVTTMSTKILNRFSLSDT
jgi:hypothetical protein